MLSSWLPASFLAIVALGSAAAATPATRPAQFPGPDRVLPIQPEATVHAIAISPDGKTAYALITGRDVDLTRMLLRYWPEVLAAGLGLWALRRVWRVKDRPQMAGAEHCRTCNYLLIGLSSQRCPECGTVLTARTRLRGRSAVRRLLVPAIVLALSAGGYLSAAHRVPRFSSLPERFQWRITWPATWAMQRNVRWLRPYLEERDLLVAVDLEKGGVRRLLSSWPKAGRISRGDSVLISRDGRDIIVGGPGMDAPLYQVDAVAGGIVRQYPRGQRATDWPSFGLLGGDLFTGTFGQRGEATVIRWQLSTGQKVGELILPPLPARSTRHSLQLVPNEKHLLAVEYVSGDTQFHMRVHVLEPTPLALVRSFPIERIHVYYACRDRCGSQTPSAGFAVLAMSGDHPKERAAGIWDAASGQRLRTIPQPPQELLPPDRVARQPTEAALDRIDITPDGRLLLGSMFGQSRRLGVYDNAAGRWLGAMDTSSSICWAPYPAISPDGRLYVTARRASARPGHDLAVYDLTRWGGKRQ